MWVVTEAGIFWRERIGVKKFKSSAGWGDTEGDGNGIFHFIFLL